MAYLETITPPALEPLAPAPEATRSLTGMPRRRASLEIVWAERRRHIQQMLLAATLAAGTIIAVAGAMLSRLL
jgi:hypothetical protein